MNKKLLDQLSPDEQPIAAKLQDTAQALNVSPAFQWDLERRLMEKHGNRTQPAGWVSKLAPALGWTFAAVCAVLLLNWTIRSLVPGLSAASGETPTPELTFEESVRLGNICPGPLAVGHGFSAFLSDPDKTGFITLDESRTIGELRTVAWSPDGEQLAVVGNTAGGGNIYLVDPEGIQLRPVLSGSELGYLRGIAWSRDGKQLSVWSSQNFTSVYLVNKDGTGLKEVPLGMQIFGTPQFSPDGKSIVFYGVDSSSAGLFEFRLDGSRTRLISGLVENESGFAWSPDGTRLAYFLADRVLGEAHLVTENYQSGEKTVLATLPIPKGSGSSIPDVANLSWSRDGRLIVFEFGRSATDRAIHLAFADGSGLVKAAEAAHAPAISADGNCLAYISEKQVFLMDLTNVSPDSPPPPPLFLADLPAGRAIGDFRLDQLQWKP